MELAISFNRSSVNGTNIFNNGMGQNIKFYYDLLELMGHQPFFMCFDDPINGGEIVASAGTGQATVDINSKPYRFEHFQSVVASGRPIPIVFEIGITVLEDQRTALRSTNCAKIIAIRYGNSLILDTEMMLFKPDGGQLHLTGVDGLWYSPHFQRAKSYYETIYKCPSAVAPYLWEPDFVLEGFQDIQVDESPTIYVMEPNINVVKTCLIPVCILDRLYSATPDSFARGLIISGDNLQNQNYFLTNIVASLPVLQAESNKVFFTPRAKFEDVFIKKNIMLGHHWHNSLNYLYCEALYKGVPLVHNSEDFKNVGYYYEDSDIDEGLKQLQAAIEEFAEPQNISVAHDFLFQYSIHNPQVQNEYQRLIEGVISTS